jgi:hypothetical protein
MVSSTEMISRCAFSDNYHYGTTINVNCINGLDELLERKRQQNGIAISTILKNNTRSLSE